MARALFEFEFEVCICAVMCNCYTGPEIIWILAYCEGGRVNHTLQRTKSTTSTAHYQNPQSKCSHDNVLRSNNPSPNCWTNAIQNLSSTLQGQHYRVVQKFGTIILYALTLPNINRFSKLFHDQNQEKICSNTITKDPTVPQVCRYTTLWNVNCLKSNNWKQDDFCSNTF